MTINEAINIRKSRRSYTGEDLTAEQVRHLRGLIFDINEKNGLRFELVLDNSDAFDGFRKSYGMFSGVTNYIIVAGPESENLFVQLGYFGEHLVIEATRLGLGTCWVGGTFDRDSVQVPPSCTMYGVITVGETKKQLTIKESFIKTLTKRKTKSIEDMAPGSQSTPPWFTAGMKCVQKAPSAANAQPVTFQYNDGIVTASVSGAKMREYIDLGIAMYHFEIGVGGGKWELKNNGKFIPAANFTKYFD